MLLHYLGKQTTRKLDLFHLNVACCFANKHTKHKNITWSQLNHHSKWSTVYTRRDLGRENSILQYVTLTLEVYQLLSRCRMPCQKWELFFIRPGLKVSEQYCWVSYYLKKCWRLDDNFVFQQDSALVHLCSTKSNAAVQNSFLLSCGSITVQSLTPLTMRFRESYSSMSISCK